MSLSPTSALPHIKVNNIGKCYTLAKSANQPSETTLLWSLKNISFALSQGESLGIIGVNGSGKTTLLKILSGIIKPSEGQIEISGRVLSIIDLGAGFHPDLSGRENIFMAAQLMLDMSPKEVTEQLDHIIAFSELANFIDQPVKTYSNGMYLRLALSIVFFCPADVLIIDEIFSAGDIQFIQKCYNKMTAFKEAGKTIVFATHNMNDVLKLCDQCIWLANGQINHYGDTEEIVAHYQRENFIAARTASKNLTPKTIFNSYEAEVDSVKIIAISVHQAGEQWPTAKLDYNQPIEFKINYEKKTSNIEVEFSLVLTDHSSNSILSAPQYLQHLQQDNKHTPSGTYEITCLFPAQLLNLGMYNIHLRVLENTFTKVLFLTNCLTFEILTTKPEQEKILETTPVQFVPTLTWQSHPTTSTH